MNSYLLGRTSSLINYFNFRYGVGLGTFHFFTHAYVGNTFFMEQV